MVDAQKLNTLLDWMKQSIGEDLFAILIVDRDGLVIASSMKKGIDEALLGGMAALVEPVLTRISKEFKSGSFGTGTFDTEDYRLIFCEAGLQAILVLVADPMASIDQLFPYTYLCAEKVIRIFDGRPVSPVVPNFADEGKLKLESQELRQIVVEKGNFIMKVFLGGDGAVGKTTLVTQFIQEQFDTDYKSTIGVSIMKKAITFPEWDVEVRLTIFDLAGQQQFKKVRQTYFAGAKAGFLVYDVTRPETFENVRTWHQEAVRAESDILIMLIANKIDKEDERKVTEEQGRQLAEELGCTYFETSALNKDIVDEAFKTLAFLFVRQESIIKAVGK